MAEGRKRETTHTLYGFGDGFDWRSTSFLEPLPSELVCSYCGFVCKWTARLPCSHTACTRCFRKSERRPYTCVLDGTCCTDSGVSWSALSEDRLAQLSIRCWNVNNGCGASGPAFYILSHFMRDCEYHAVMCSFCSKSLLLCNLNRHLASRCFQAFLANGALARKAETDSTSTSSDVPSSVEENLPSTEPPSHDSDSDMSLTNQRPFQRVLDKYEEANVEKALNSVLVATVSVEDTVGQSRRLGEVYRESQCKAWEACARVKIFTINGSRDAAEEVDRWGSSKSASGAENSGVLTVCNTDKMLYASGESLGHYLRLLWESIPSVKERHDHADEAQRTSFQWHTSSSREAEEAKETLTGLTNGIVTTQVHSTHGDEPDGTGEQECGMPKIEETSTLRECADLIKFDMNCNSHGLPYSVLLHRDWLHENHLITAETLIEFVIGFSEGGPPQLVPKLEGPITLLSKTVEGING
ncbi:hypothetical protein MRX96_041781 [Rhipicephalus microplus]